MNKGQLIEALAEASGLGRPDATRAVDALFGEGGVIVHALRGGDKVQITGFGTFQTRDRAARTGRNPQTGEPIAIPGAKVPAFKAGQQLKDALAKG
jgi:DNA-binding protein HU-beta